MSHETDGSMDTPGAESRFSPPPLTSLDPAVVAEAQAFANAESQFDPPLPPSTQSPLLDRTLVSEIEAFLNNDDQAQKRKEARDLHDMRMSHSRLLLGLAMIWIFVILIVVLLQGFGQWFTPLLEGYTYIRFKLSDTIIVAFITSTTATVLGLYGIAAYWLYGKPKPADATENK